MKYIDFLSLYPTVMFYDYYPVGHQEKMLRPNYFDKDWYGFIKCITIPSRELYHPVLPVKVSVKMLIN